MPPYQGTTGTIRTAVIDRLKLDVNLDPARVLEWMNLAYAQVVQETGCFQTCGTLLITSSDAGYTLPSDVMLIKSIHYTYDDGTLSIPFEKVSLDEILRYRQQATPGTDRAGRTLYAVLGQNRIELWPNPTDSSALKFWYVYLPPALVSPTDPVLIKEPYGSKLLELGACVEGAKFKKDPLLNAYQSEYDQWLRRFQGWLNRRQTGTGVSMRLLTDTTEPQLQLARDVG